MDGKDQFIPRTFGANDMQMDGSFQTIGATTGALPRSYLNEPKGMGRTLVTHAGSGLYIVSLPGMSYPNHAWRVLVGNSIESGGTFYDVKQVGQDTLNSAAPTFTVQCYNASGVAVAPADLAGNRINFSLIAGNTTGG